MIVRYFQGRTNSTNEIVWESEPKVQAIFQRYTARKDDWRASGHYGDFFGSPSGISQEDCLLLCDLLKGSMVSRGKIRVILKIPPLIQLTAGQPNQTICTLVESASS